MTTTTNTTNRPGTVRWSPITDGLVRLLCRRQLPNSGRAYIPAQRSPKPTHSLFSLFHGWR